MNTYDQFSQIMNIFIANVVIVFFAFLLASCDAPPTSSDFTTRSDVVLAPFDADGVESALVNFNGTVIDLYGDSNTFADVQDAVRTPNATVVLHGAFDWEGSTLNMDVPDVTLRGESPDRTMLTRIFNGASGNAGAVRVFAGGVTVRDLHFDLTSEGSSVLGVGVLFASGNAVTIENNIVGPVRGIPFFGMAGIDASQNEADVAIVNNRILLGDLSWGIVVWPSIGRKSVIGNQLVAVGEADTGILAIFSTDAIIQRNTFLREGGSYGTAGIVLVAGQNHVVGSNTFVDIPDVPSISAFRLFGLSPNGHQILQNDYLQSGVPGLRNDGWPPSVLLDVGTENCLVFESGNFPAGTGGAKYHVLDVSALPVADGGMGQTTNRVTGHPQEFQEGDMGPGIGQRVLEARASLEEALSRLAEMCAARGGTFNPQTGGCEFS